MTILACWGVARVVAWGRGIQDRGFTYEHQLPMWRQDDQMGFANQPNFQAYCWGTVLVQTNERGFRGRQPVRQTKTPGTFRIVCMGDSVMWGAGASEQQTIPYLLAAELQSWHGVEVINAGVISYSTLQERLFLEHALLPLKPDLVVVNLCDNDLLPTDDPFTNVRGIYRDYLQAKAGSQPGPAMIRLIERFDRPHVTSEFERMEAELDQLAFQELWVSPILEMGRMCHERGVPLVYLLIPPRTMLAEYDLLVARLLPYFREAGIQWVDFREDLKLDGSEVPGLSEKGSQVRFVGKEWFSLPTTIRHVNYMKEIHQHCKHIDHWHLAERGSRIVGLKLAGVVSDLVRDREMLERLPPGFDKRR